MNFSQNRFFFNKENNSGKIQLIFGPMFSGKSTELLRRVRRLQLGGHKCLLVKHKMDERYNRDDVTTHCGQSLKAAHRVSRLSELTDYLNDVTVVAIDEGQFFPDIVEFAESSANRGLLVLVAALDATFERKSFNRIEQLLPLAEDVVKLTAVCDGCHGDASFTQRISDETKVEVVGGTDKYRAVCRRCFFKARKSDVITVSTVTMVDVTNAAV